MQLRCVLVRRLLVFFNGNLEEPANGPEADVTSLRSFLTKQYVMQPCITSHSLHYPPDDDAVVVRCGAKLSSWASRNYRSMRSDSVVQRRGLDKGLEDLQKWE